MALPQDWFEVNDGLPCGCIIPEPVVPRPKRRFSPDCRCIDIGPSTPQLYLNVAPSVQRNGHQITFNNDRSYMKVFRKGREDIEIATYNVWRRDANGALGWYFDNVLFDQPSGFFVGDVYLNCVYCFSVQLRLPPCEAVITSCYTQPILENCGAGECSLIQVTGEGMVGGGDCALPPPVTECGTIAPYYSLENPLEPLPPCTDTSVCSFTPDPAGFVPAGIVE